MSNPRTPISTDKTGRPKFPPNDNDGSQNPSRQTAKSKKKCSMIFSVSEPGWFNRTDNKQQQPSPTKVANQPNVSNRNRGNSFRSFHSYHLAY